jgi:hypothetical protein
VFQKLLDASSVAHRAAVSGITVLVLGGCFGASSSTAPPSSDASTVDDGSTVVEAGADAPAPDAGGVSPEAASPEASIAPILDAGPSCQMQTAPDPLSPALEGIPADGLVLWLRADRGVFVTSMDAGAPGDGGLPGVCAWADVSGNGWVLENGSTTLPSLRPTGVGGQPGLEFASTTSALQTSGVLGIDPTSPRTLVAVDALVNAGGRFDPIAQGETGSAGTYLTIDTNPYETTGNLEGVYMTSNAFDTGTATMAAVARVHVYTVSAMTIGTPITDSVDYRVNGITQTLTLLPGGSDGTFQDFSAANFTSVGSSFTSSTGLGPDAIVAEVLVYDRALTLAESEAIEAAMNSRYGIQ